MFSIWTSLKFHLLVKELTSLEEKAFENIVGKGENGGNQPIHAENQLTVYQTTLSCNVKG